MISLESTFIKLYIYEYYLTKHTFKLPTHRKNCLLRYHLVFVSLQKH